MGAKVSVQMLRARELIAQGVTAAEAARQAGISKGAISKDAVCRQAAENARKKPQDAA